MGQDVAFRQKWRVAFLFVRPSQPSVSTRFLFVTSLRHLSVDTTHDAEMEKDGESRGPVSRTLFSPMARGRLQLRDMKLFGLMGNWRPSLNTMRGHFG